MAWVIVIAIVAAFFAVKKGVPAAARAIGSAWRNRGENGRTWAEKRRAKKQLTSDAVDSGMAPTATKAGGMAGVATGAVISGARLAFAAFLRAWREGWKEGTARAEARRNQARNTTTSTDGTDDSATDAVDNNFKCSECGTDIRTVPGVRTASLCAACTADQLSAGSDTDGCVEPVIEGENVRRCGEPKADGSDLCRTHLDALEEARRREREENHRSTPEHCALDGQVVDGNKITCHRDAEPGKPNCRYHEEWLRIHNAMKGRTMPVETANGSGEIHTYDQFIAELSAAGKEALSDIEDAKVQEKLAKENLQRAEVMANALKKIQLPDEVVDAIKKSKDALNSQVKSCGERIKAGELVHAQMQIALTAATTSGQKTFYRG